MENKEINNKILELWKKYSKITPLPYYPGFFPDLKKKSILFVGLNPSFTSKADNYSSRGCKPKEFYEFKSDHSLEQSNKVMNEEIEGEKQMKIREKGLSEYPYFTKFIRISKDVGLPWEHIDLFFYRETSQNKFKKIIGYEEKNKEFTKINNFGEEQLKISLEIIDKIDSKVIVVSNALASKILKKRLNLEWDSERGYYLYKKIPVFLSGMLTGQRALDLGSLERLKWHIGEALKMLNEECPEDGCEWCDGKK